MFHRFHLTTVAVVLLVANLSATGWDTWLLPQSDDHAESGPADPVEDSFDISLDELLCESVYELSPGAIKGGRRYPLSAAPLYALCVTSDLLRPPRNG